MVRSPCARDQAYAYAYALSCAYVVISRGRPRVPMQGNGRETGGIRHKLGSLFSPRGPPPSSRGKEEVDHGTFITADVLQVRGVAWM